jgi:4-amino-4-deoxy-L-arabinose transferase-like glycosyltransferase
VTRPAALAVGLVLLATLVLRLPFLDVPLERDEGEYAYAGQLIRQGIPPYLLAYNMKLPGMYAAAALAMSVFGETPLGLRLGLLTVALATSLLVAWLGGRLLGPAGAVVAGVVHAVLAAHHVVLGQAAHATQFVALPAVGGLSLLLAALRRPDRWRFFLSGVLFGVAFVVKQPGVVFAGFAVSAVVAAELTAPAPPGRSARRLTGRLAWLGAGFLLPLLATGAVLLRAGVFARFWFWTVTYASAYVTQLSGARALEYLAGWLRDTWWPTWPLWLLAAAGLVALARRGRAGLAAPFVLGLLAWSLAGFAIGFYFRPHYFVLVLPAFALLVAAGVPALVGWLAVPGVRPALARGVAGGALAAALAYAVLQQFAYVPAGAPAAASRALYQLDPFPEMAEVARYLRGRSRPDERIAVLGSEPEVYFLAGRHSATGYIYAYPLVEPHPHAGRMQREMIAEIEAARPAFVVFVAVPTSWNFRPGSETTVLDWSKVYLPRHFRRVGVADMVTWGRTEYRWGAAAEATDPRSPYNVLVFERRDRVPGGPGS